MCHDYVDESSQFCVSSVSFFLQLISFWLSSQPQRKIVNSARISVANLWFIRSFPIRNCISGTLLSCWDSWCVSGIIIRLGVGNPGLYKVKQMRIREK